MKKFSFLAAIAVLGIGATSFALRSQGAPAPTTPATVAIDQKVASFSLPNSSGKSVSVGDWGKSKATVIIFVATRCPVSNAYNARMVSLDKAFSAKGVRFIGINSNKQEDSSEIGQHSRRNGFKFDVLKDAGNKIADRFDAQVTPEAYVVGSNGVLLYHGRIDNSQNEGEVNDKSLQNTLDAVLVGKPVPTKETRAFGCSIKREG